MSQAQKKNLLILFFAFQMASLMYVATVYLRAYKTPERGTLLSYGQAQPYCYAIAAAGLIAAIFWAVTKRRTASYPSFQTQVIYGMGLTQISGLAGLALSICGARPVEIWRFILPALAVSFVFYLPRILVR